MSVTKKIDKILDESNKLNEGKIKDAFKKMIAKGKGMADKAFAKLSMGVLLDLFKMGGTPRQVYNNLALSEPSVQKNMIHAMGMYMKKNNDPNIAELMKMIDKDPFK
jgi:hypothetical protein